MPKIKPIKDLRNTNEISKLTHEIDEPIFITKNGYQDMVVMSNEYYDKNFNKHNTCKVNSVELDNNFIPLKQCDNNYGFVRVGAGNFNVCLSNVKENVKKIKDIILDALKKEIHVLVLPELCLCGYSLRDLFFQNETLDQIHDSIVELANFSKDKNIIVFIGAPLTYQGGLYNCAVAINNGEILGVIPKTYIPNYNEFYEARQFRSGLDIKKDYILIKDKLYPFGREILFRCLNHYNLCIGVEICEDLWSNLPPSTYLAQNGATLIVNLSASNELISKDDYRLDLVKMTSGRLICSYAYASAGQGESTTDVIYSSHNIICENARILSNSELFKNNLVYSEIDIERLVNERRRTSTFFTTNDNYLNIGFKLDIVINNLVRYINPNPFLITNKKQALSRYRKILKMQALSLKKRVEAAHSDSLVIGLSGGLDSTLALLVSKETFKLMNKDLKKVYAITLPCFGTSQRTHDNAKALANALGVSFKEININETIKSHFKDIGHDIKNENATFENAQARERTQVLMDFANDHNALMVGTGDLSELCLGWTTYNGDHMSMYGVNASIPKTLVIELVNTYGLDHQEVAQILEDIILTPISPELLPLDNGKIIQKTEEKIGPYELVDFFIYYFLRCNFKPSKILFLAKQAYHEKYQVEEIKKWLKIFLKRFYQNQFKRSCLPDGVKIGSVCISPRGDLRMPSDADVNELISSLD